MTKLLLNFLLIYAIITVITAILILWRGRKDRDVILIIAGSSAIAVLLFYLFYIPAMNTAKQTQSSPLSEAMVGSAQNQPTPLSEAMVGSIQPVAEAHRETPEDPKGPFPTDATATEKERQIGRLFNIWRQSVLTRNITQINQLDSQIKGCGNEAIPFLTKLAKEDRNERVRAFATRILGRMNLSDLFSLFVELLKNDTSAFVRENSCWSLSRLGNIEALEILQKVADSDSSAQVRKAASEAIEKIKSTK
ncbi:MAG TPA: HEAT repeat domain-containing protein [Planctomycetota bacterium]|nr:HEAT repeat domain-containing protein [Planctomycetota bacterium]